MIVQWKLAAGEPIRSAVQRPRLVARTNLGAWTQVVSSEQLHVLEAASPVEPVVKPSDLVRSVAAERDSDVPQVPQESAGSLGATEDTLASAL